MNWYKENYSEWKEIIETVARELGRNEQMIEKDTIQSMFLHELAQLELPFVFKGGTSLSKAYDLIDEVRDDRMLSKNNPSAQLQYNIPKLLKEIICTRFYEADYRDVTQKLLYEDISYDRVIEHGIAIVADSDVFEYKKN